LPLPASVARLGDATLTLNQGTRAGKSLRMVGRLLGGGVQARWYAVRLKRRLRELQPTLIHSNGIKCHLLAPWLRLPGVPIIWHVHDFLAWRRLVSKALRWASPTIALALANSHAVEAEIRALMPGVPTQTIHYGIDLDYF